MLTAEKWIGARDHTPPGPRWSGLGGVRERSAQKVQRRNAATTGDAALQRKTWKARPSTQRRGGGARFSRPGARPVRAEDTRSRERIQGSLPDLHPPCEIHDQATRWRRGKRTGGDVKRGGCRRWMPGASERDDPLRPGRPPQHQYRNAQAGLRARECGGFTATETPSQVEHPVALCFGLYSLTVAGAAPESRGLASFAHRFPV